MSHLKFSNNEVYIYSNTPPRSGQDTISVSTRIKAGFYSEFSFPKKVRFTKINKPNILCN